MSIEEVSKALFPEPNLLIDLQEAIVMSDLLTERIS